MTNEARKLAEWVNELRGRDGGQLARLVLIHVVKGNRLGDEVRTMTAPPGFTEEWAHEIADRIITKATTEADALGGKLQTYAVRAFFEGEDGSTDRHVFSVEARDPGSRLSLDTESPDGEGMAAQAMRHTEFYASMHAQTSMATIRELRDEIKELRRENSELRANALKNWKVFEELHSAAADRQLAHRAQAHNQKLTEDAIEKLWLLGPTALNMFAGRQILPEKMGSAALLLKSFVESISPDDFQKWSAVLRPEQLGAFMQLATSVSPPKPDEVAAAAAAASTALEKTAPNGVTK